MPGHVKKTDGPDPCPDQWLMVSDELKVKLKSKPYDPKKSYWSPDGKGNYMECTLVDNDGTKAVVMCGHEVSLLFCSNNVKVLSTYKTSSCCLSTVEKTQQFSKALQKCFPKMVVFDIKIIL